MKVRPFIIVGLLAWASLPGCKDKARTMSRYPYFLKTLNERWEIARQSFQSDKPNISYAPVLLKDLYGTLEAMRDTYDGPNRDAAIAKLEEVAKSLQTDIDKQLDMRYGDARLLPGVTEKDVGQAIDRAYEHYREFAELVKL